MGLDRGIPARQGAARQARDPLTGRVAETGHDGDRARDDRVKRSLDVLGAIVLLILIAPLLLTAALAVRLSGPGPVLFRQDRYGQAGRVFRIYKFRTMRGAAPDAHAIGDPTDHATRTTPVGHMLRRYCIDELPQLFNVLSGEMSLVGPRAHPVDLHVLGVPYETVVPDYHRRHAVRPGMTGLAQVSGFHGIVDGVEHARQRVAHDLLYIGARSTRLDLALVLFTGWRFLVRGGRGERPFPIARFLPAEALAPPSPAAGPHLPSDRSRPIPA